MEEMHRARYVGKGVELPRFIWAPLSQHLHMLTNLEALQSHRFGFFMEASSHGHDCLNHGPLVIELNL